MARPGSNAGRSSSVTEVGDRFGREGPAMVRALGVLPILLAATLGLAAPGFAQTAVPNWNVTVPADPGHAVQRVTLTATAIAIDRTFSENKARVVIPRKRVGCERRRPGTRPAIGGAQQCGALAQRVAARGVFLTW